MGAPAITFACKHGTIRVVGFDKTEGGGWRRREEWTPKDSSRQAVLESSFCASNTDDSFRQDEAGYDSRCACCYLGFAHTEALQCLTGWRRSTAPRKRSHGHVQLHLFGF
jgi:hypothetical protein